jgi:predicted CXXCH cytochrome family protein
MSCVGGCHGSGHGSEQNALLAPVGGPAQTATDFCYQCHDSDGPSTIDIQSQYAAWTRPPVTSGSGAPADEKHSLPCADCHSPHADNSTNPVSNIDTGAALALYSDNLGSYGVGADPTFGVPQPDYIEFCLVCHDNSPPPGVTIPGGMRDMNAAWFSNDQHGTGDGNGSGNGFLKPPYNSGTGEPGNFAALNCTTCHGAHGSGNIFNLRTSINVGGTQMTVGGWLGDTIGEDPLTPGVARQNQTVYELPLIGGQQQDHQWGAWCSFCHQIESHGRDEDVACTSGHMHGLKQF